MNNYMSQKINIINKIHKALQTRGNRFCEQNYLKLVSQI